jgi:hypothetical protein
VIQKIELTDTLSFSVSIEIHIKMTSILSVLEEAYQDIFIKKAVLAGRTEKAPGIVVEWLSSEQKRLDEIVSSTESVLAEVKMTWDFALSPIKWCSLMFGSQWDMRRRKNERTLSKWCCDLMYLESIKDMSSKSDDFREAGGTDQHSEGWKELIHAACVTAICLTALEKQQMEEWKDKYGPEWSRPRRSLNEWCGDLLFAQKDLWDVKLKRNAIRVQLNKMGWNYNMNCWLVCTDPIWKELYEAAGSPPLLIHRSDSSDSDLFNDSDAAACDAIELSLQEL